MRCVKNRDSQEEREEKEIIKLYCIATQYAVDIADHILRNNKRSTLAQSYRDRWKELPDLKTLESDERSEAIRDLFSGIQTLLDASPLADLHSVEHHIQWLMETSKVMGYQWIEETQGQPYSSYVILLLERARNIMQSQQVQKEALSTILRLLQKTYDRIESQQTLEYIGESVRQSLLSCIRSLTLRAARMQSPNVQQSLAQSRLISILSLLETANDMLPQEAQEALQRCGLPSIVSLLEKACEIVPQESQKAIQKDNSSSILSLLHKARDSMLQETEEIPQECDLMHIVSLLEKVSEIKASQRRAESVEESNSILSLLERAYKIIGGEFELSCKSDSLESPSHVTENPRSSSMPPTDKCESGPSMAESQPKFHSAPNSPKSNTISPQSGLQDRRKTLLRSKSYKSQEGHKLPRSSTGCFGKL